MERILITGGAGFLGSHLCDLFVGLGHDVICMANLIKSENIDNVAHLIGHERFKFIRHDVTEYLYVEGKVDSILHFASLASPKDYLDYPIQTLKVGALGTHKALGLAREKKARFLLASTSEIYGDPEVHPHEDEADRLGRHHRDTAGEADGCPAFDLILERIRLEACAGLQPGRSGGIVHARKHLEHRACLYV